LSAGRVEGCLQEDGVGHGCTHPAIMTVRAAMVLARLADAWRKSRFEAARPRAGLCHARGASRGLWALPVPAVEALLRADWAEKASDFDVSESNEAFAAQAVAVTVGLGLDPAIVNPNGGAIRAWATRSVATGAIL